MDPLQTINYSGIFLSCYCNDGVKCTHMVRDHALVYILSGELLLEENGEQKSIRRGESIFLRRDHRVNMTKKPYGEEQFQGIFLTFRRNLLREFYNRMENRELLLTVRKPEKSIAKIPQSPAITSLFQSLMPYFDSHLQPTEEIIHLKELEGIYALLDLDRSFYPVLFDFTEPWKIDILDFLNENYMYELSMEEIASFTGRSLSTFKRDFAKISDLPPQKWLIQKRLESAYDKLRHEGKKASDVYIEVGFKNLSHFYTAFKRQYGFSPGK